jgi:hypothetical protein
LHLFCVASVETTDLKTCSDSAVCPQVFVRIRALLAIDRATKTIKNKKVFWLVFCSNIAHRVLCVLLLVVLCVLLVS